MDAKTTWGLIIGIPVGLFCLFITALFYYCCIRPKRGKHRETEELVQNNPFPKTEPSAPPLESPTSAPHPPSAATNPPQSSGQPVATYNSPEFGTVHPRVTIIFSGVGDTHADSYIPPSNASFHSRHPSGGGSSGPPPSNQRVDTRGLLHPRSGHRDVQNRGELYDGGSHRDDWRGPPRNRDNSPRGSPRGYPPRGYPRGRDYGLRGSPTDRFDGNRYRRRSYSPPENGEQRRRRQSWSPPRVSPGSDFTDSRRSHRDWGQSGPPPDFHGRSPRGRRPPRNLSPMQPHNRRDDARRSPSPRDLGPSDNERQRRSPRERDPSQQNGRIGAPRGRSPRDCRGPPRYSNQGIGPPPRRPGSPRDDYGPRRPETSAPLLADDLPPAYDTVLKLGTTNFTMEGAMIGASDTDRPVETANSEDTRLNTESSSSGDTTNQGIGFVSSDASESNVSSPAYTDVPLDALLLV